jgi:hypothetical protein
MKTKEEIKEIILKDDTNIYYGERYAVESLSEMSKNKKGHIKFKMVQWCVAVIERIDEMEKTVSIPVEYFDKDALDKAIDRFIELEENSDIKLETPELYYIDVYPEEDE